jgi:O-antigen/teichoic acid export membrane protein
MSDRAGIGRLFLRGSLFELGGFAVTQVLRLGSNLVFTRLLYPDAYGLTLMVGTVVQALVLFSDVGIQQAVIQNPKGDDERFLNTAWTMQIVRTVVLSSLCAALAYPMASFYEEPDLGPLLLVAAVQVLLLGFHSTAYYTLRRRVASGLLNLVEVVAQLASIGATAIWAAFDRSVWALVAGSLASVATRVVVSHLLPVGHRNRFGWDPKMRDEILRFGRWILASSAAYYFARQADRVMLGRFADAAVIGVYSVALTLTEAVGSVTDRLVAGVLYPVFSRLGSGNIPELRSVYYHIRIRMDAVSQTTLGALAVFSDEIVRLLWDARYHDAGWMMRILVFRVALHCVFYPWECCLMGIGRPRDAFLRSLAKGVSSVVLVPVGYAVGGIPGLIWGTVIAELPSLFVLVPPFRRLGLLRPGREVLPFAFFAGGAAAAWLCERALGF